jgi:hypothetical protein
MGRWEALALGGLFLTQFFFTDETIRIIYACIYLVIAGIVFMRDIPRIPTFARAVRRTLKDPSGNAGKDGEDNNEHPP